MRRTVLCGLNWIGDTLMSMPAVQAFRDEHPDVFLAMLVKPPMAALWRLHSAPDEVLTIENGIGGMLRCAADLRGGGFDRAYVLPHSFRSACAPALAGIPERWGLPGHCRDALLTRVVPPPRDEGREHQAWEYIELLAPTSRDRPLQAPRQELPAKEIRQAGTALEALPPPRIGLLPGAARGPAKRWPPERFAETGRLIAGMFGASLVIFGSPGEQQLCTRIAAHCGPRVLNLAGRTSLPAWAASLAACDAVVANDSGGMHLAAAVGTPVVALFGTTDPMRTGPLGSNVRILQQSARRNRDIKRHDPRAEAALLALRPEEVAAALTSLQIPSLAKGEKPCAP